MTDTGQQLRHDVLNLDDIARAVPALGRHPRLAGAMMRLIGIDRCNALHGNNYLRRPGADVTDGILRDLDITLRIDGEEILDSLPGQGAFITVSNHPFGALDGIALIDIVARRRPDFKVMVNKILNQISGMRHNFIAVDPASSADPAKRAASVRGIREALGHVRQGHPLGFFPAGAMSKLNPKMQLVDRPWADNVVRLVQQCAVPVVPIFFHGRNTLAFDLLGLVSWQLRTLRLPSEVFRKAHSTIHITVGRPITPEEQKLHQGSLDQFGRWLKEQTYNLARP